MIKRLIWTIWTALSSVPKKADKLNLTLSLWLWVSIYTNQPYQRAVLKRQDDRILIICIHGLRGRQPFEKKTHTAPFSVSGCITTLMFYPIGDCEFAKILNDSRTVIFIDI